jgi:hypothetical protein
MPTFFTAKDRHIRPLPAGCDQQGRYETRSHRVLRWEEDTAADDPGASRGCIEDCTDMGELPTEVAPSMPAPSNGFVLLVASLFVAIIAACAVLA